MLLDRLRKACAHPDFVWPSQEDLSGNEADQTALPPPAFALLPRKRPASSAAVLVKKARRDEAADDSGDLSDFIVSDSDEADCSSEIKSESCDRDDIAEPSEAEEASDADDGGFGELLVDPAVADVANSKKGPAAVRGVLRVEDDEDRDEDTSTAVERPAAMTAPAAVAWRCAQATRRPATITEIFPPSYVPGALQTLAASAKGVSPMVATSPPSGPAVDRAILALSQSAKLAFLASLIASTRRHAPTDRFVLISNYTQTLDLLQGVCVAHGYPFVRLDGSTPNDKRNDIIASFNAPSSPVLVFLLSSLAGGVGINLVSANRLVMFDESWNPAINRQAIARVWREGQKKKTFIYRLVSTHTIEEKILQRQLLKETTADMWDLPEGGATDEDKTEPQISARGASKSLPTQVKEGGPRFSQEELKALFALDPGSGDTCDTEKLMNASADSSGSYREGWAPYMGPSAFSSTDKPLAEAIKSLDESNGTEEACHVTFVSQLDFNLK